MTRLLTVAHGTRRPGGNRIAHQITRAAGRRLGVPAVATYVELCTPAFAEEVRPDDIIVPLLLSTGHHMRHDLALAAGRSSVGGALGPHPLLARSQADRLLDAGAVPGQPVVLVAAGSSDQLASRDHESAAAMLAAEWGGRIGIATLSGHGQRIEEVVGPGIAVSPYLLSPGFFSDRARRLSLLSGATVVADVLGAHHGVIDLVVQRASRGGGARLSA